MNLEKQALKQLAVKMMILTIWITLFPLPSHPPPPPKKIKEFCIFFFLIMQLKDKSFGKRDIGGVPLNIK